MTSQKRFWKHFWKHLRTALA